MSRGNVEKKFVKIQSSQTVRVTAGLQYDDFTKKNSDLPDRMKIAPQWPKLMILIRQGQHTYPAEIAEWNTVKALEKDGILTIGAFVDVDDEGEATADNQRLNEAVAEINGRSLSEIVGD